MRLPIVLLLCSFQSCHCNPGGKERAERYRKEHPSLIFGNVDEYRPLVERVGPYGHTWAEMPSQPSSIAGGVLPLDAETSHPQLNEYVYRALSKDLRAGGPDAVKTVVLLFWEGCRDYIDRATNQGLGACAGVRLYVVDRASATLLAGVVLRGREPPEESLTRDESVAILEEHAEHIAAYLEHLPRR